MKDEREDDQDKQVKRLPNVDLRMYFVRSTQTSLMNDGFPINTFIIIIIYIIRSSNNIYKTSLMI